MDVTIAQREYRCLYQMSLCYEQIAHYFDTNERQTVSDVRDIMDASRQQMTRLSSTDYTPIVTTAAAETAETEAAETSE